MLQNLLRTLYPDKCPFCKEVLKSGERVCTSCSLPFVSPQVDVKKYSAHNDCFDFAYSVFYYEPIVQKAILQYKYYAEGSKYMPAGRVFAGYMKGLLLQKVKPNYHLVGFVPMAKKDLKKRKYNQAEHLARTLSKELNLHCEELLLKTKQNQTQHDLPASERLENVKDVYALNPKHNIQGKTILLVDDILTTGATLNECSRVLKQQGAKRVDIITLAVTRPKR